MSRTFSRSNRLLISSVQFLQFEGMYRSMNVLNNMSKCNICDNIFINLVARFGILLRV